MTKVSIVKAMVFPVVTYRCESWTIKKAECWRNDAFRLWCWRRLLRTPLDSKEIQPVHPKGDQSWVFIGRNDVEAEAPVLWPPNAELTHWKRSWCWERLRAEEKGTTENEMVRKTTDSVDMNLSKLWKTVKDEEPDMVHSMRSKRVGYDLVMEQQLQYLISWKYT